MIALPHLSSQMCLLAVYLFIFNSNTWFRMVECISDYLPIVVSYVALVILLVLLLQIGDLCALSYNF